MGGDEGVWVWGRRCAGRRPKLSAPPRAGASRYHMSSSAALAAHSKRLTGPSPLLSQQAVIGLFHALASAPPSARDAACQALSDCLCHTSEVGRGGDGGVRPYCMGLHAHTWPA
jgi:hypothetical protein